VVLGGEDVAGRPRKLGAERLERLDENGCLDGCGAVLAIAVSKMQWQDEAYSCADIQQCGRPSVAGRQRTSGESP
jgi:hypothetical protein